jgi:hypothetical protein
MSNGNGTTALAIHTTTAPIERSQAFEPSSIDEALRLSKLLVASHLLPKGVQTPEAAFAIVLTGRELGLTAMQSLRSLHIIEGKPTMSADLVAALVKSRPEVCEYFRLVESSAEAATYETKRKGEPSPTRMSFTMADATRAGVTAKDNWRKYPSAMLRARCITALARAVYPDLVLGVYDPDELGGESAPAAAPVTYEAVETRPAPKPAPVVEVVQQAPPAPPSQPRGTFAELLARVDAAASPAELNAIAKATQAAHVAGAIGDEQRDTIAAAGRNRRKALAEAPRVDAQTGEVQ